LYDEFLCNLFHSVSGLAIAVESASILSISELEMEVAVTFPSLQTELSRIVDYFIVVSARESEEFIRSNITASELRYSQFVLPKYLGRTFFVKTMGGPQYYRALFCTKWNDTSYGWSALISVLSGKPRCLQGGHYDAFSGANLECILRGFD